MERFVHQFNRDRRMAERHDHRTPIRVRVRRRDSKECVAQSKNLSTSGVFVETDLALSEGAALDLFFEMPHRVSGLPSAHWLCLGHVVRVVPSAAANAKRGIGVQFDCYEVSRSEQSQNCFSEAAGR
jgi:Tfp pilus assembly protein PilZ